MTKQMKISPKSLATKPDEILKGMQGGVFSVQVARIVGRAKGFGIKATEWGPQVVLRGDFKASVSGVGEVVRNKIAFLPECTALGKIVALLKEKKGDVDFVVDLCIEKINIKKEAAGHRFYLSVIIDPMLSSVNDDPLQRLENSITLKEFVD
jgi:hypothetical protein